MDHTKGLLNPGITSEKVDEVKISLAKSKSLGNLN